MSDVISLALISDEVRQRIVNITLDELWAVLDGHCSTCSDCDAHTLCAEGQKILLGIMETMGHDQVVVAKVAA